MPIYVQQCGTCKTQFDVFRKIAELNTPVPCTSCGESTQRVIMAPMVRPDYEGYESPATGKWIEGRKAHREDLARSGCRIREPGETEEFMRNHKKIQDKNNDFIVSEAMNKTFAEMGIDADAHRIDTSHIPDTPAEDTYHRSTVVNP